MQLVDEENDVARRRRFVDESADALLVLPAERRSGEKADVIQRQQAYVAQDGRNASLGDALRETLGDRGLADARRSDQRRIVLTVAKEDVDDALDLGIAAANRLQSPGASVGGQIASEALQRVTFGP